MTTWLAVAESLEDLDTCVKIVSTSPSSASSQHQQASADLQLDSPASLSKSCHDLSTPKQEQPLSRSQSCVSLTGSAKYDLAQSKNTNVWNDAPYKPPPAEESKEEYLQEINTRLIRELEEKNASLQQLQENYEHLLLKYAEAQNKIDNLRFQSSASGESSRKQKKSYVKKLPKPSVYNYKNPMLSECKGPFSQELSNDVKIDRPSTLAVDNTVRGFEKDLKAVTPTDSEGMSSVVTSMSGHSKILTNLDEKEEAKPALKSEILEKTLPVFDKVTHWQNSLPPLDLIEKPDSSFFDADTPSTKYNDIALSDLENIPEGSEWGQGRVMSQIGMKKYLRTLSLPSSLTRRNILAQIYKRKNNHTIDVTTPIVGECHSPICDVARPEITEPKDVNLIQRRRKPPPFMRSSSLPIYECDSPRVITRCPVPPLDFENLALSEDETSPISKDPSSFLASHECSFQTLDSLNSCKATLSEISTTPRQTCFTLHKSTSITPDRSQFFCEGNPFGSSCCNICGEDIGATKAASYHGVHRPDDKQPLCRSFSSNMVSPSRRTAESDFDAFAINLKARSQITMKALTAHVNNS